MPRILDNRDSHVLVQEDGEVKLIPWSPRNKLLYKHGLHGLIVDRSEILSLRGPPAVEIAPDGDSGFSIKVSHDDHEEFEDKVRIPPHGVQDLLEALATVYDTPERDVTPILSLVRERLDFDVAPGIVRPLANVEPFDSTVEIVKDGWLIHDHVLLTYNNEFFHPKQRGYTRNGSTIDDSANQEAYEVRFHRRPNSDGQAELTGFEGTGYSDVLVDFVRRALWAVTYAPESGV